MAFKIFLFLLCAVGVGSFWGVLSDTDAKILLFWLCALGLVFLFGFFGGRSAALTLYKRENKIKK